MLRVCFQQRKLFVGTGADFLREGMVLLPKIGGGAMLHWGLERLCAAVLLVVQGALDGHVEASGRKIGLDASVDRRRAVLLKPCVQFLNFARRERSDGAFDFLDGVKAHGTFILTRADGISPERGLMLGVIYICTPAPASDPTTAPSNTGR